MDKGFAIAVVVTLAIWLGFLIQLFNYNLPTWCEHPDRPGNSIIQPLCK